MHLLLIEDDQAYQLAMATHLRQLAGVQQVWVAEDGEMGLELLTSKSVDLVLLDLVLPGLGGLATCRRITVNTALPVLILTSQEDTGWVRQIWDAGARGYLHKERALAQVELALASLKVGASWWDQKASAALQRSGSHPAVAASRRRILHTSKPSTSGSIRSSTIRAGRSSRAVAMARAPSLAKIGV